MAMKKGTVKGSVANDFYGETERPTGNNVEDKPFSYKDSGEGEDNEKGGLNIGVFTNRGYPGGSELDTLIGAEKVPAPEGTDQEMPTSSSGSSFKKQISKK